MVHGGFKVEKKLHIKDLINVYLLRKNIPRDPFTDFLKSSLCRGFTHVNS
jgi:hypothetical protein